MITGPGRRLRRSNGDDDDDEGLRDEADKRRSVQPRTCNANTAQLNQSATQCCLLLFSISPE